MTPAIISVHYHLRPGGVTQVIRNTERILGDAGIPHLTLSEEAGIPELGYRSEASGDLSSVLLEAAEQQLGERPRLWHLHNPCLGKNPALTRSLQKLAVAGEAMILQHHDLAEEDRPENLAVLERVADPYPDSPRIAHAFLNHRDRTILIKAGLPEDRGVVLPNPAPTQPALPPPPKGSAVVLLPMRGIPRKNLGEMLLLAAAAPVGTRFLQGSAPSRDEWKPAYEKWRQFAGEQKLPVEFDVFGQRPPEAHIANSTHLLTTSRQEGFGLIHLEAAHRRRVIGRRIDYLDLDGFPLDGLYDVLVCDGVDFGLLDDDAQREIIRSVGLGKTGIEVVHQGQTSPLHEWLRQQLEDRIPGDASRGLARHADSAHLKRLSALQQRLLDATPGSIHQLDRRIIAAAFE